MMDIFWLIILVVILSAAVRSAWFKGMMGEFFINIRLRLLLSSSSCHLLKNITLPIEDGSTQVDHIIVSQYGVFVIETKNRKGWIFGGKRQRMWTQQIYKYSNKFQNPLHQNYKHTKTLAALLEIDEASIFSVIVFTGSCTFKTPMPDNVIKASGLIRFIKSKVQIVFSLEEVQAIVDTIEENRLAPSFSTDYAHTQHVKNIVSDKLNSPSCPACGQVMIKRTAKVGRNKGNKFWGCRNFPQCKATLDFTS